MSDFSAFDNAPALSAASHELEERRVEREVLGAFVVSTGQLLAIDPHTQLDREALGVLLPAGEHQLIVFTSRGEPALAQLVVNDAPVTDWALVETAPVDSGTLMIVDEASRQGLVAAASSDSGDEDDASLYDFIEDAIAEHDESKSFIFKPAFQPRQTIALFGVGDGNYPIWVGRDVTGAVACVVVDFHVLRGGDGRDERELYIASARAPRASQSQHIAAACAAVDAGDSLALGVMLQDRVVEPHDILVDRAATLLSHAIEANAVGAVEVLARYASDLTLPVFLRAKGLRTYFELATLPSRANLKIAELLRPGHHAALAALVTPHRMPLAEARLLLDPAVRPATAEGEALVVEDDFRTQILDLDALVSPSLTTMIIAGDLEAEGIVSTGDRAIRVIVAGNVRCGSCVLGPQVLEVEGDCSFESLFFGDGPGLLLVTGGLDAQVLIALDEFSIGAERTMIHHRIIEAEQHPGEDLLLGRYLAADLVSRQPRPPHQPVRETAERNRLGATLRDGGLLLHPDDLLGKPRYPETISDLAFADAEELAGKKEQFTALFELIPRDRPEQSFELDAGTTVYVNRAHKRATDGRKTEDCLVCVGPGDIELYVMQRRGIQMVGRGAGRGSVGDVFDHPQLRALGERAWRATFERANGYAHYQRLLNEVVSSRAIIALVETPVVRALYDRWQSDDDDEPGYFWRGRHFFQFKSASRDDARSIVRVGEEAATEDFDVASFDFTVAGDEPVAPWSITYRQSQENDSKPLALFEPALHERALAMFRLALHAVAEHNEAYLRAQREGQPEGDGPA